MVVLRPERAAVIRGRRHPWVYSQAVASASEEARSGALVPLEDGAGGTLGWGFYSPRSLIAFRLVSSGPERPGTGWILRRLQAALELRRALGVPWEAFRVANAEGDRLPGLIVDLSHRTLVVRPSIRGMEAALPEVQSALGQLFPEHALFLKRDERAGRLEGLRLASGYLSGSGEGREVIGEGDLRFVVDMARGQKTGFYLDQRDSRLLVRRLAEGRRVLNLFAYTGAFALQAAAGGALQAVSVESSRAALELGRACAALNPGLEAGRLQWVEGDAFRYLAEPSGGPGFDLVIVDPPPFARRRSDLGGALKAYTELNRLALGRLAPGGLLMSFSCSSAVSALQFTETLREAARQAARQVQLLQPLSASADHPVALEHPEGEYLKGWLLRAP
jgi:23S rRNA (cytosine1962-C5)-methyltransferase